MRKHLTHLLLFDVDGTLVESRGVGREALDLAFRDRYGWEDACCGISFAGGTDPWIVESVFVRFGRSAEEARAEQSAVFLDYIRHLRARVTPGVYYPLPGTLELVQRLQSQETTMLGVLTGNIQAGANLKLEVAGFGTHWYETGAFGDDAPTRNDLLSVALRRANAKIPTGGLPLRPESTVIIGDTPRDIAVARAHGARAVAVATGACSREELADHDPDALLDDMQDTDRALAAIFSRLKT